MAELEVKERQAGDVTILDMSGAVRRGEGSVALRNAIRGLVDQGKHKILLNLGGQLKRLNLTDRIQNLLVITKLLTVFDAYDNEAEALSSFK